MKRHNRIESGMSLTELLVVMIIMGILASLLMPTISRIRSQARKTKCIAQLKQIGVALKVFEVDRGVYPNWLSNLSPDYIRQVDRSDTGEPLTRQKPFVCPNDFANPPGSEGRLSPSIQGIDRFEELNDTEEGGGTGQSVYVGKGRWSTGMPKVSPSSVRNQSIRYCSYSYEFAIPECSYERGRTYADDLGNRDGVVSWREMKTIVEQDGVQGIVNGQPDIDRKQAYAGRVPIVRCFWHIPAETEISRIRSDPRNIVLNLRSGDMSVDQSDPTEDGWKKD